MTLYIARKGNGQFYIQPEDIKRYTELGYQILKMEPVPVENVSAEYALVKNRNTVKLALSKDTEEQ